MEVPRQGMVDGGSVRPETRPAVRSSRRVGFGVCLALAIGVWLWARSNLTVPFFPSVLAAFVLFGMGVWWLCLVALAILRRQRPPLVVLITPFVVLPLVALGLTTVPIKARWLATEPVFNAIVERAGPPTLRPATAEDEDEGWSELAPCPTMIGSYLVTECSQFPGGYLFFDAAGSGLIDDGGVAYLPNGVPDDAGTGWFESPEFTHLHGPWYAFASSW